MVNLKGVYTVNDIYQRCLHGKNRVTKYCAVFYQVKSCFLHSKLENGGTNE